MTDLQSQIEGIDSADLVIGIVGSHNSDNGDGSTPVKDMVETAVGALPAKPRTVVISAALQSVLSAGGTLGAQACCVVASDLHTVTPRWISRLVEPVLQDGIDLVMPCYARHKFEGLLNSGIISPLSQALYGKRIQNPMGPDFGCSKRVINRMSSLNSAAAAEKAPAATAESQAPLLARLAPEAIGAGYQLCQAHVGARVYPPIDWMNLSGVVAQVLGPIFADMDRNAALWQRTRGSMAIPRRGEAAPISDETGVIDVQRMIESFQLGAKNLFEIWGLVLPPASQLEVRKLARLAPSDFRMSDDLWARIVYDFALGYRFRTINRDHLLGALTPLYLGWVASYALELESRGPIEVEQRLEKLATAYEAAKPYLLSRWRWPDRFSP